jgi:hypothetical protein
LRCRIFVFSYSRHESQARRLRRSRTDVRMSRIVPIGGLIRAAAGDRVANGACSADDRIVIRFVCPDGILMDSHPLACVMPSTIIHGSRTRHRISSRIT